METDMIYTPPLGDPLSNSLGVSLGDMLIRADETGLTGIWFLNQRYFPQDASETFRSSEGSGSVHPGDGSESSCLEAARESLHLEAARRWLDIYFSGGIPDFTPALHLMGTPFQLKIWNLLLEIPYGETITYGELWKKYSVGTASAKNNGGHAVGGAVGRNPVSIIVPCHRVMGAGGTLTGYGGGLWRKEALLALEKKGLFAGSSSSGAR